jgi:hypothetical protein
MPVFSEAFGGGFDASDSNRWPNGKPKSMAKGKPSKGTGKDKRLKRNKGKKKRRK